MEDFFEIIDALSLPINVRFHADNLNIMKEMFIFCHENLLKNSYSMRADNLYKHYNLDPNIVGKELVKIKNFTS